MEKIKTNVATSSGVDLPSIMGKVHASAKDPVVTLRDAKEELGSPGPTSHGDAVRLADIPKALLTGVAKQ